MSRNIHIYCFNERELRTKDTPPWMSVRCHGVMLGCSFLLCSECIIIAIKWMGFTKNNHLRSGICYTNALPAVIIFIKTISSDFPSDPSHYYRMHA